MAKRVCGILNSTSSELSSQQQSVLHSFFAEDEGTDGCDEWSDPPITGNLFLNHNNECFYLKKNLFCLFFASFELLKRNTMN